MGLPAAYRQGAEGDKARDVTSSRASVQRPRGPWLCLLADKGRSLRHGFATRSSPDRVRDARRPGCRRYRRLERPALLPARVRGPKRRRPVRGPAFISRQVHGEIRPRPGSRRGRGPPRGRPARRRGRRRRRPANSGEQGGVSLKLAALRALLRQLRREESHAPSFARTARQTGRGRRRRAFGTEGVCGVRRRWRRQRPAGRAYEGTCRSRHNARPAMKAERSTRPIWLPLVPKLSSQARLAADYRLGGIACSASASTRCASLANRREQPSSRREPLQQLFPAKRRMTTPP
jgi:hypothetical protein